MSKTEIPQLQSPSSPLTHSQGDEIELRDLLRVVWQGKWLIACITVMFSLSSVFYALSIPNEYSSTAILSPASTSNSSSMASLAGQFGGLASLAGVSLDDAGSNKTLEALEILQSWAFIEEFIQEQNIAPQVFAVKGWNQETNELIYNTEVYDPQNQIWTREPPKGKQAKPSSWELYKVFNEVVVIRAVFWSCAWGIRRGVKPKRSGLFQSCP